jgi:tetratricopeptide (TPR) repeat protein
VVVEGALSRALQRAENAETSTGRIRAVESALRLEGRTESPKFGKRGLLRGVLLTRLGAELTSLGGRRHEARLERAIGLLEEARQNLSAAIGRVERALAQIALANALYERSSGDRNENIERALSLYVAAIRNLDRKANREEWGQAHLNLGSCYADRVKGLRERNVVRAISAYDAALGVYDRHREPEDWALAQMNRALVLSERHGGDREAAQQGAIAGLYKALTVRTRRRFPREWATCQSNLGALHFERINGDRAENLELSIAAFENALKVRSRRDAPDDWATTKHNLALALSERVRGTRDENIERALRTLREVLTVRTKRKSPAQWAKTQAAIAMIFYDRVRGVRSENLERVIAAGKGALSVLDSQVTPSDWAHAQTVTANAYGDRVKGDRRENIETGIAMLQSVVEKVSRHSVPISWATAHLNLATAFLTRVAGSRAENLERSIGHSNKALVVFTKSAAPMDWASIQANLANAFYFRSLGDRAENLEGAIRASGRALSVFTARDHPIDWAMVLANRANALRDRIVGNRSENLEHALSAVHAALRVLRRERAPTEWAAAREVQATVLLNRVCGSPRQNIETGIGSIREAIEVYASNRMPINWAQAQGTLASLYLRRISGVISDNVEHAIAACRDALSVFCPDNHPMDWAAAQTDLAIAFFERSRGRRSDNLEQATEALKAALTVYSLRDTPLEWGRTQGNLANMYALREEGARTENVANAIAASEQSLMVFKKRATPHEWAIGTMNVAVALQQVETDRGGGLDASIAALTDALTVLNASDHPLDWGMAQTNLGNALRWRAAESDARDFRLSISAYRRALKVFTRSRFPEQHLRTMRVLGAAYSAAGQWRFADRAFTEARATADLIMGLGLHPGEQSRVLGEISHLGRQSALARIRCGDCLGALNLLENSRSVELAMSLRLEAIKLSKEEARRLHDLRRQARAAEEVLQAPDVENPKAMVQRLSLLHSEICRMVTAYREADEDTANVEYLLKDLLDEDTCVLAPIITEHGSAGLVARRGERGLVVSHVDIPLRAKSVEATPTAVSAIAAGLTRSVRFASPIIEADAIERAWTLFGQVLTEAGVAKDSRIIILTPGDAGPLTPALAARGGEALLNDFEVTVAPSLTLALTAKRRAQTPRKASLGAVINPTLSLDGAVVEYAMVSAQFAPEQQAAAIGKAATAQAVAKVVRSKSHWLLATHGQFYRANGRDSWLALAGGRRLYMNDALFSSRSRGPRLVVLSACESGLHEQRLRPEEFRGFAGLFLQMGAAGVIVAAWPVDDTATAFLIGRFFRYHIAEALNVATALRRAQLWLRDATVEELTSTFREASQKANAAQRRAFATCRQRFSGLAPGAVPFSAPEHWAGFTLMGA